MAFAAVEETLATGIAADGAAVGALIGFAVCLWRGYEDFETIVACQHRGSARKCHHLPVMNGALDPRHVLPALLVLVALSLSAAQLTFDPLQGYGILVLIIAASMLTYNGARAVTRRDDRTSTRAASRNR